METLGSRSQKIYGRISHQYPNHSNFFNDISVIINIKYTINFRKIEYLSKGGRVRRDRGHSGTIENDGYAKGHTAAEQRPKANLESETQIIIRIVNI